MFKEKLPPYYENSSETNAIQDALEPQATAMRGVFDECLLQLNPTTATDWGITLWERALGIESDASKDIEYRRTRVRSKLRGAGMTTVEFLKNVAMSFSNGEVDIIEHNADYYFAVDFVGTLGLPPNLDDLKAVIEDAKPAHLGVVYLFRYTMHSALTAYTHDALAAYLHEEVRTLA